MPAELEYTVPAEIRLEYEIAGVGELYAFYEFFYVHLPSDLLFNPELETLDTLCFEPSGPLPYHMSVFIRKPSTALAELIRLAVKPIKALPFEAASATFVLFHLD